LIIQERKHSVSTNNEIDAESGSKTRAKKIDPTPECPEILNYLSLTPDPFLGPTRHTITGAFTTFPSPHYELLSQSKLIILIKGNHRRGINNAISA
jgi:hypothetical protein